MDITPSLNQELGKRARGLLRKRRFSEDPETLSLVDRACEKMLKGEEHRFESRAQFLTYAAMTMRSVLINLARDRTTAKRGGGERPAELEEGAVPEQRDAETLILDVNDRLRDLARHDPKLAQLVELRFFGGCTWDEVATVMKQPVDAVKADWSFARMWLKAGLADED